MSPRKWLYTVVGLLLFACVASAADPDTLNPVPQANSSFLSDLQNYLREEDTDRYAEAFSGFIVSGGVISPGAGLTKVPTALIAYPGGARITETGSIVFQDATTTWVIASRTISGNVGVYVRVAGTHYLTRVQATEPTLPADSVVIAKVVTSGGSVSTVTDLRLLSPLGLRGIPSYTLDRLPPASTAGRLARVTDNIRGIWEDTGTEWVSITGWANVKDFGARGDNSTNDTLALSTAQTAANVNGAKLYFPKGTYLTDPMSLGSADWGGRWVGEGWNHSLGATGNPQVILRLRATAAQLLTINGVHNWSAHGINFDGNLLSTVAVLNFPGTVSTTGLLFEDVIVNRTTPTTGDLVRMDGTNQIDHVVFRRFYLRQSEDDSTRARRALRISNTNAFLNTFEHGEFRFADILLDYSQGSASVYSSDILSWTTRAIRLENIVQTFVLDGNYTETPAGPTEFLRQDATAGVNSPRAIVIRNNTIATDAIFNFSAQQTVLLQGNFFGGNVEIDTKNAFSTQNIIDGGGNRFDTGKGFVFQDSGGIGGGRGIYKNLEAVEVKESRGQRIEILSATEETTIAAAATTDTAIQIPSNAIVLGVPVRVTVAIPTAATFTVTATTSGTAFQTGASVSTALGSNDVGTKSCPFLNAAAAQTIRITPNLTPGAATGKVRVTIFYILVTAPTA